MTHPLRTLLITGALVAGGVGLAGCGSSSGSDATPSTTRATSTSSPATTSTEATTSTTAGSSTTAAGGSTTTTYSGTADRLPPCEQLLQEYTDRFTMDDLTDAAAFFREYAPYMPDDVAAASRRIADAYEAADGDPANLNFSDVDLTADAQTFSDWTNDGCPAG
jgi:hypothetical protein